jgi:hypothetical protein
MIYSALKNSVFKVLHKFLNKYVTEIQLPGNGIQQLSILQSSNRVLAWLGIDDFPHIMYKCSCI